MKAKHAVTLLVFGFCLDFLGTMQKIIHAPSATTIFYIAVILKVAGALLLLYKLVTYPKFKDFMNK